ncbi:MAG: D-sedoheptulose 7-phosphate isomerase [Desulfovibrio sp.]|nr:D-sedoheptulose 7-phosphate isomerase [Desulfovibrio sp.]
MDVQTIILSHARDGAALRERFFAASWSDLARAARVTAERLTRGGTVYLCGNGGSAADAQHIAGEFVNRFLCDRPALPALALTTDTSVLTAIGNDTSFDQVFSRQLEAFAKKDDILFAISTSGTSKNVLRALATAEERNLFTICLTGEGGTALDGKVDVLLAVPSRHTPLIQEVHLACEHLFCQLVDYFLFENVAALYEPLPGTR